MRTWNLAVALIVSAAPLCAQQNCGQDSARSAPRSWTGGYWWCDRDQAPRLTGSPHWSDSTVRGIQKHPAIWGLLTFEVLIDTLGVPTRVYSPRSRFLDTVVARRLTTELMRWRFVPAIRDGRRVNAYDSIYIQLPIRSRTPPRPCLECAPRDGVTRWEVDTRSPAQAQCDRAAAILLRDSITSADGWIYQAVSRCPEGENVLARYFATRPPPGRWEPLGPPRATMIASLAGPDLVDALIQSARRGHRYALRFLPIALGLGFERVTDTTAGRWNAARGSPEVSCGALRVYIPFPGSKSRRVDPHEVRRVLAFADSVASDAETPSPLRSTAWCLSKQLR